MCVVGVDYNPKLSDFTDGVELSFLSLFYNSFVQILKKISLTKESI